jgi:hypothetical protein
MLAADELLALRREADLFQFSRVRATTQIAGRLLPTRHPRGDA